MQANHPLKANSALFNLGQQVQKSLPCEGGAVAIALVVLVGCCVSVRCIAAPVPGSDAHDPAATQAAENKATVDLSTRGHTGVRKWTALETIR